MGRVLLLYCILCLHLAGTLAWDPSKFPNPQNDLTRCGRRGVPSRICDPDGVISYTAANVVEGTIKDIEAAREPFAESPCTQRVTPGYQVAVALMRKMDLRAGESAEDGAARFARQLFDVWGVGDAGCNNGVLLLLALQDRQVYIYAGRGAASAAPNDRLAAVIDNMRPLLRAGKFDEAVEQGVADMGLVLAGADVEQKESIFPTIAFFSILAGVLGWFGWSAHKARGERNKAKALLDKLKREQATALRTGQYPAASCPICFEDFNPAPLRPGGSDNDATPSAPPLPMGKYGVQGGTSASGAGEDGGTREALLKKEAPETKDKENGGAASRKIKPLGLPCGHTFCEPCISKWLEEHGSCPVCRKPVSEEPPRPQAPPCQQQRVAGDQLFQDELMFRLGGLHRLYPSVITMPMVTTMGGQARNGELVDWEAARAAQLVDWEAARAAQLQDQALHDQRAYAGQFGSSGGFGGGHSGGGSGVGGSW